MSLYGFVRMLESRDLGPTQLLPPLQAFAGEVREIREVVPALAALAAAPEIPDAVRPALELLVQASRTITSRTLELFGDAPAKLGARERLRLEREAASVGTELQGLRDAVQVVDSALHLRPARLTLSELLNGRWRTRPSFVERRVELLVACAHAQFEGDPRVLWGLVECSLGAVVAAGVKHPFASLAERPGGRVVEIGEVHSGGSDSIERVVVELGRPLPITGAVLAVIAHATGADIACESSSPTLRRIGVAA